MFPPGSLHNPLSLKIWPDALFLGLLMSPGCVCIPILLQCLVIIYISDSLTSCEPFLKARDSTIWITWVLTKHSEHSRHLHMLEWMNKWMKSTALESWLYSNHITLPWKFFKNSRHYLHRPCHLARVSHDAIRWLLNFQFFITPLIHWVTSVALKQNTS